MADAHKWCIQHRPLPVQYVDVHTLMDLDDER
jgi:hypothetical protein